MKDEIARKILNGEAVRFSVDGPDKALEDLRIWLKQFSGMCNDRYVLNCNSHIVKNVESLDIRVGVLADGQRALLTSTIASLNGFEIKLIP